MGSLPGLVIQDELGAARTSCERSEVSGFRYEKSDATLSVRLGDLVSNQVAQVVLALTFPARAEGDEVTVHVAVAAAGADRAPETATLTWRTADPTANDRQPRDREVDRLVADQYARRGRLEAVRRNAVGDYEGTGRVLSAVAGRIRGYAGDDAELNRVASERIEQREEFARVMAPSERLAHYAGSSSRLRSRERKGRSRRRES